MSGKSRTHMNFLAATTLALAFVPGLPANAQSPAAPSSATEIPEVETIGAVLQGLDKVTARISTFEAGFDQPVAFGSLIIRVRACHRTPPTEAPESTAFVEIEDSRHPGDDPSVFTGWMFASSPAIAALEHPVYDVWVVDCMKAASSSSDNSG